MSAITCHGASAAPTVRERKNVFARLVEAMLEARLRQARAEIARHSHLLPRDWEPSGAIPKTEDELPFNR